MPDEGVVPKVPESLARIKDIWEWAAWAISAFGAVTGLVESAGGPVGFLTQVALFGFSCYIAAVPVVLLSVLLFSSLDKAAGRQTHDKVIIGFLVLAILAGGYLVRSLLYDGIGRPGDLDTIGTTFAVIVGAVVLLTPVYFLWHRYGSIKSP